MSAGVSTDSVLTTEFRLIVAAELQQEVENLALRLHYVNNAKEDVRSDIAVMKRAAERADVEVSQAEAQKQKQVWSVVFNSHLPLKKRRCRSLKIVTVEVKINAKSLLRNKWEE